MTHRSHWRQRVRNDITDYEENFQFDRLRRFREITEQRLRRGSFKNVPKPVAASLLRRGNRG
jgi:hypothetical protein